MIRRLILGAVILMALVAPVSAQFIVYDPTNYANAVLRYRNCNSNWPSSSRPTSRFAPSTFCCCSNRSSCR